MFFRRLFLGAIFLAGFGWLSIVYSIPSVPDPVVEAPIEINRDDESIVPASSRAPNPKVQNGDIYDKAVLKVADIKTLIVPENAKVERTGAEGPIELYVKKTQSFGGHPPEPMTLESARKKMGCATKTANATVTLATYGEFSTKEGGAHMKLLLRVPAALTVETQPGLSGPESGGHKRQSGAYLTKEPDTKDGYWYGPSSAGPRWKAIPMEPDVKRTAK
jgi:hypothetical protein